METRNIIALITPTIFLFSCEKKVEDKAPTPVPPSENKVSRISSSIETNQKEIEIPKRLEAQEGDPEDLSNLKNILVSFRENKNTAAKSSRLIQENWISSFNNTPNRNLENKLNNNDSSILDSIRNKDLELMSDTDTIQSAIIYTTVISKMLSRSTEEPYLYGEIPTVLEKQYNHSTPRQGDVLLALLVRDVIPISDGLHTIERHQWDNWKKMATSENHLYRYIATTLLKKAQLTDSEKENYKQLFKDENSELVLGSLNTL